MKLLIIVCLATVSSCAVDHNADVVNAKSWQLEFDDPRFAARTQQPSEGLQATCDPGCDCTFSLAMDYNDVDHSEATYDEKCPNVNLDLWCIVFFTGNTTGYGDCNAWPIVVPAGNSGNEPSIPLTLTIVR